MLAHVAALFAESPEDARFALSPDGPTRARMALFATLALIGVVALGALQRRAAAVAIGPGASCTPTSPRSRSRSASATPCSPTARSTAPAPRSCSPSAPRACSASPPPTSPAPRRRAPLDLQPLVLEVELALDPVHDVVGDLARCCAARRPRARCASSTVRTIFWYLRERCS